MSGIVAVIHWDGRPVQPGVVQAMASRSGFRGPPAIRVHLPGDAAFAHLALNTTPESVDEGQPVADGDSGLVITADARIDNREALIASLAAGRGASDADLILRAYGRWGTDCAAHLEGDFAFVIWDGRLRRVYAARDQSGVRSLHFSQFGNTLCFASDAWQILAYPGFKETLCEEALLEWATGELTNRYSMFENVRPVPSGSQVHATADRLRVERYWDIDPERSVRYRDTAEYAAHLRSLLERAVSVRLRTGASRVGAELSGGLDSTVVAALASRSVAPLAKSLEAVSYHYPTLKSCDETPFSLAVARHLGIGTHLIDAERHGMPNYPVAYRPFPENPWCGRNPLLEEEYAHFSALGVDVVLTGTGGDELAGGFHVPHHRFWKGDFAVVGEILEDCRRTREPRLATIYRQLVRPGLPDWAHDALRMLAGRGPPAPRWPSWLPKAQRARLEAMRSAAVRGAPRFDSRARQAMYQNLFVFARTAASSSSYEHVASQLGIEVRHPFLDKNVVEFCFAVPPSLWHRDGYAKWLLRVAAGGLLPESVRWRRDKKGVSAALRMGVECNGAFVRHILQTDPPEARTIVLPREFATAYTGDMAEGISRRWSELGSAFSLKCWLQARSEASGTPDAG